MKWIKTILGLGALVVVVSYLVAFFSVLAVSRQDQARPVPAIVVLGAAQYNGKPSPVLKARLDHAARLYADSVAPLIVLTGGVAAGDKTSEAEAAAAGYPDRSSAARSTRRALPSPRSRSGTP